MHPLSLFFPAAVLAFAAAMPHPTTTLSIPIRKRSSLATNGMVELAALRSHVALSEAKVLRGMAAFERNTGLTLGCSNPVDRRTAGPVALTDDGNERWYGSIQVGTPAVEYKVDFDTGSADLFLPGSNCGTCSGHTLYNPNASSSSTDLNKTFILEYGDGSTVQGEQYTDTVILGGFTATNQALGVASQYSSSLSSPNFTPDGLMGLAFESLSQFGANPVFQTLVSDNLVSDPVFAFKLASSGSELSIGGVNSALYSGSITYTQVTQQGFWQVNVDALSADGADIITDFSAIVDTGTTLILGDSAMVGQFYAALNATSIGSGYYTLPCNSMPSVSITIGGKAFALSADTFNLGAYDTSGETCVGAITAGGSLGDMWILGDTFLRNVYSVFDLGQARVGFANLA
ncbi:aspartic peptidase domain-containing protein [Phlebopus sp. FC_14]|nr:aspartic peptidase domain-containing protein [Phlebopus sp. FC_14]